MDSRAFETKVINNAISTVSMQSDLYCSLIDIER